MNIKITGNNGLWKISKCVTRLLLEWKLFVDLSEQGLETQEVETKAWKRKINTEVKKIRTTYNGHERLNSTSSHVFTIDTTDPYMPCGGATAVAG